MFADRRHRTDEFRLSISPANGEGQYVGTVDSLTNYSYPDWFRDVN
ncbi:MAG TPA: hypothetical protein VHC44_04825 [Verrucomicrobiae bacterium]|nr:hypothetical protein [Verrucomicrobiae bacterium]